MKPLQEADRLDLSQLRNDTLLDHNIAGLFRTEFDGTMVFCNEAFAKVLGYEDGKELIGSNIIDHYFDPRDREVVVRELQDRKNLTNYEVSCRTKEGKQIWILFNAGLVREKKKFYIEGTAVDITQRKRYEKELENSRENYRRLVNRSPDGVVVISDKKVDFANSSAFQILGSEELIGQADLTVVNTLHPDFREEFHQKLKAAEQGKDTPLFNARIEHSDLEVEISLLTLTLLGNSSIQLMFRNLTQEKLLVKEQLRAEIAEENNRKLQKEIRERKKTEKKLKKSEERFRLLYERNLAGVFRTSYNGKVLDCNEAYAKIMGYPTQEDVIGISTLGFYFQPSGRTKYLNDLEKMGVLTNYELRQRRQDGSEVWVLANVFCDEDEDGERYIEGTIIDISDRKGQEKKLVEGRENFKYLVEYSPEGIVLLVEDKIKYANPSGQKVLGFDQPSKLKDRTFSRFILKEYRDKVKTLLSETSEYKELPFVEAKLQRKDEKIIDVELKAIGFSYKGKHAVQLLLRDLTEIKRSKKRLLRSEEKYRAIYNQAYIGIAQVALSGKFMQANSRFCKILGYSEDGLKGMNFTEITHPGDKEESLSLTDSLLREGIDRVYFEKRYIHKDGSTIHANITLAVVYDERQKPDYFVVVLEDITERKKTERKIKESLREKEILLKEVHHRVKNNLQVISSILNLQSSYVKDKNTLEMLRESQNRIKSMSFIHESLYQTKDFSNINFSDYIMNLSQNLIHSYQIYGDEVQIHYEVEEVLLNIDQAIPCGLIINELVSNALKYAFPDNRKGIVLFELGEENDLVKLIISDNGVGLPDGLDYENTESLGLQLVTTLVSQLNGDIALETSEGTKFTITFKQQNIPAIGE